MSEEMSIKEFVNYELPFIFDSGNTSTSQVTTTDGSGFTVTLEVPLIISEKSKYAWITVYNATVWNNTFNIVLNVNDQIEVEYFDGFITVNHTLLVPSGLYDLQHLQAAVVREFIRVGLPDDLFILVPDTSTERVIFQFNYSGIQIDMTDGGTPRNFRGILGFNSRLIPAVPTTGIQFEEGDVVAAFNTTNYYLLHSDLIHRGIRINGIYQQTIALVNIDVKPGSQINYNPQVTPRIPANELIGTKRKTIEFWLTNNNNKRVDTNGQSWSVSLIVHYIASMKD